MAIEVVYAFPAEVNGEKQAEIIAVGQTVGSWNADFSHCEKALRSHLAEVVNVTRTETGESWVRIRFPESNVENDIPSLLTMIFGKYSLGGIAKVMTVDLPDHYGISPRFGIGGIRQLLGVFDRPLVMAIFKPALGLTAQQHGEILEEVAFAGLDIIKDDEILGDLERAPTLERLRVCREVLARVKAETGRTVLYAINVTGNARTLVKKARELVREGANALLLNVLSYGFSVLEALATDEEINVPIFAHPALAGAMCLSPNYGFAYPVVLGTFMAHSGADAVLYPAHYGNLPFNIQDEEKIRKILCSRSVFPVPSAGIRLEILPNIVSEYGRDVILNAGTGIMDYPQGRGKGVQAFLDSLK